MLGAILVRRWARVIVGSALFSVLIEVTQYFTGRAADIDDVLLNTVGAAVGALVVLGVRNWRRFAGEQGMSSNGPGIGGRLPD